MILDINLVSVIWYKWWLQLQKKACSCSKLELTFNWLTSKGQICVFSIDSRGTKDINTHY